MVSPHLVLQGSEGLHKGLVHNVLTEAPQQDSLPMPIVEVVMPWVMTITGLCLSTTTPCYSCLT